MFLINTVSGLFKGENPSMIFISSSGHGLLLFRFESEDFVCLGHVFVQTCMYILYMFLQFFILTRIELKKRVNFSMGTKTLR